MQHNQAKKLVFENGASFMGAGFGADVERVCEVVFNTAMVGYQEIFSDPSYNEQFVCMAYPLIGNYGMADDDYETRIPRIGGFIVREYNDSLANFRAAKTLAEAMEEYGVPGISGLDTRRITRMIRDEGSMRAILCAADVTDEDAVAKIKAAPVPHTQVATVSSKKRWYARAAGIKYNVVAIDCGIKQSIIKSLQRRRCNVTVVPYNTSAEDILKLAPDGVFLSNGPGDPADVAPVIGVVKQLWGKTPIFGICLGHQMIALAAGCKTYKLKFGHRGANHPVKNLATGKIEITSQNHSFAVDEPSIKGTKLHVTHRNLLDDTVEGLATKDGMVFSVQYHPESCPGAQDSAYLFETFVQNMEKNMKKGGHAHA